MKAERRWTVFKEASPDNKNQGRPWCVIRGLMFPRHGPGCRRFSSKEDAMIAARHSAERRGGLVCIAQTETGHVNACCLRLVLKPLLELSNEEVDIMLAGQGAIPQEPTCQCLRVRRTELPEP